MGAKAEALLARGFVRVPNRLRELEVRPFDVKRYSVSYALHREFPYGAGKKVLPKNLLREAEHHSIGIVANGRPLVKCFDRRCMTVALRGIVYRHLMNECTLGFGVSVGLADVL